MTLERILLQTIKFDLQVEHPYTFLLKYAKCFKGDQQKLQKMVQMAWNFVNDSLSTVVCLQWEPEIIAVALIHLASKLSKFTVADWVGRQPAHLRWWDMFVSDVTMEILEDICHQVLDLYQTNQQQQNESHNSPPQKPPSRADSPTPLKSNASGTGPTGSATDSPAAKSKNSQTASGIGPPNTLAPLEINNIQTIKSLGTAPPTAVQESMNAASLAAAAAAYHLYTAPPMVNPHQLHSMYNSAAGTNAPSQSHSVGGSGNVGSYNTIGSTTGAPVPVVGANSGQQTTIPPPLPPPPPMAPYAAGGWPPSGMPVPSHYGAVPTMPPGAGSGQSSQAVGRVTSLPPPPPGPSGGYYQQPSYGRQSRY